MSIKSQLYFWVECDVAECCAKVPDGDECTAYDDRQATIDLATEMGWVRTPTDAFYCQDCVDDDAVDTGPRLVLSTVRGEALPGFAP